MELTAIAALVVRVNEFYSTPPKVILCDVRIINPHFRTLLLVNELLVNKWGLTLSPLCEEQ